MGRRLGDTWASGRCYGTKSSGRLGGGVASQALNERSRHLGWLRDDMDVYCAKQATWQGVCALTRRPIGKNKIKKKETFANRRKERGSDSTRLRERAYL